jgi:transcriptional regulator of arginine metabolism
MPGLAAAAGAALDGMDIPDMVGSLAGDDTVILIMRTNESAAGFCDEIHKLLK